MDTKLIVISNTTARYCIPTCDEEYLGQFQFEEQENCYKQSETECCVPVYLFRVDSQGWFITYGSRDMRDTRLKCTIDSEDIPTEGWKNFNLGDGKWNDVRTLTITPGPLTPCRKITITGSGEIATKHDNKLGTFTPTNRWYYGRPVYINTSGKFLYSQGVYFVPSWVVGDKIGDRGVRISWYQTDYNCPASCNDISTSTGFLGLTGTLSMSCTTHQKKGMIVFDNSRSEYTYPDQ